MKKIGFTTIGAKGQDDNATLKQKQFVIGDYLDVSVTIARPQGGGGGGGSLLERDGRRENRGGGGGGGGGDREARDGRGSRAYRDYR